MSDESNIKAAGIRGLRTALFTFLATFIPSLLGFLAKVMEWAESGGTAAVPTLSTLGYAAVAAFVGALSGLVSFLWNWAENAKGFAIFGAKTTQLN